MLWRRRVGLRGLAIWYVLVAAILALVTAATSSSGLHLAALIGLILIGPRRDVPVSLERREPPAVVAVAVVVFAVVVAALMGAAYGLADAFGVSVGGAFVLWIALVPATVASGEAARRVKRQVPPESPAG